MRSAHRLGPAMTLILELVRILTEKQSLAPTLHKFPVYCLLKSSVWISFVWLLSKSCVVNFVLLLGKFLFDYFGEFLACLLLNFSIG